MTAQSSPLAARDAQTVLSRLKQSLTNTWLFPRYIGLVYMHPAMRRASAYARGMLLDVGCGLRRYESILADHVERYWGLDWPQVPERARADMIGDALHIPMPDSSVDTVLATELMEHLPDPDQFVGEAARVLRAGGRFILSVPFMEPLHEEPRDYYRFTPHSLRTLLERHGFTVEYIEAKGGWWAVVLGSFVNQAMYDWANPPDQLNHRPYRLWNMLILPFCTLAQLAGYTLDRFFKTPRYTMGYVAVATVGRQTQS